MLNKISANGFMVTSTSGVTCCAETFVVVAGSVLMHLVLVHNYIYYEGEFGSLAGIFSTVV